MRRTVAYAVRVSRPPVRAPLTPETIVAAALAVADADGLDAVSMRRLAAELGVAAMSLYHHVADKDRLLELMADAIGAEMVIPGEMPGHWREALRAIAHRTRDTFLRHPWLIDTSARRPIVTANQLRHIEQSAQAVQMLEVDAASARAMVIAVDDYTIGHVFRQTKFGGERSPFTTEEDRRRLNDLLATGEFPLLARFFGAEPDRAEPDLTLPADTFEAGLEWLLDGMEQMLTARHG
jgi:AcrR family transcriptional regulator